MANAFKYAVVVFTKENTVEVIPTSWMEDAEDEVCNVIYPLLSALECVSSLY